MEVTLLVEATEGAFRILEDARKHATGIIDSAVELTSEETRHHEARRIQEIFTGAQKRKTAFQNFVGTAVILFAFWALLSGKFDAFHLTLGAICCLGVAYLTHDLLEKLSHPMYTTAQFIVFRSFSARNVLPRPGSP